MAWVQTSNFLISSFTCTNKIQWDKKNYKKKCPRVNLNSWMNNFFLDKDETEHFKFKY